MRVKNKCYPYSLIFKKNRTAENSEERLTKFALKNPFGNLPERLLQ